MKKLAAIAASIGVLALPAAAFGVTGNPNAGNSGHFKGGSQPCKSSETNPNCPPPSS